VHAALHPAPAAIYHRLTSKAVKSRLLSSRSSLNSALSMMELGDPTLLSQCCLRGGGQAELWVAPTHGRQRL
jgi:hypothetical protein